ncbi:hypothetical protein R3Q15_22415 [Gordonia amicalis]|uniref:Uncharacterized protein n=1 Tax=Gordonia amicalis TaxID=89053 RepID=A0AAE4R7Q3_9ACTN|nr:hypothetical protein [Gordonia amicalis]MDV6314589.1 hypothetical protein [Gordonia amicalis]
MPIDNNTMQQIQHARDALSRVPAGEIDRWFAASGSVPDELPTVTEPETIQRYDMPDD